MERSSRLDRITDWDIRARKATYQVKALAHQCEVSLRQLERYFVHRFRSRPHVWLNRLRMREARKLLLKGEMIKQIAPELGFKQVAHFSREFKRSFGVSPRLFAQANGKLK